MQQREKTRNKKKTKPNKTRYLTFWRLRIRVTKHLVLVTKHVVVDIEFVCNSPLEE